MADQFRRERIDVTSAPGSNGPVRCVTALRSVGMMTILSFVLTWRLLIAHGQIQVLNVGPNVCRFLVRRSESTIASGIDIFVKWSHERLILEQTDRIL